MKTIQKAIAVSMFSFLTVSAFGQLNLGVQSATQAAINATAVTRTAANLVTITNTTIQSAATKAMDATSKLTAAVQSKAGQALTTANGAADNAVNSATVNGSVGVNSTSLSSQQALGGSLTANADQSLKADGSLSGVNPSKSSVSASASTTSSTTVSKQ